MNINIRCAEEGKETKWRSDFYLFPTILVSFVSGIVEGKNLKLCC